MDDARHAFTPSVLMYAPAEPGIYLLWDADTLILVGQARAPQTVLGRLMDHYCGRAAPSRATHCGWELEHTERWLDRVGEAAAPALPAYLEID
jgi:hypothetical protein